MALISFTGFDCQSNAEFAAAFLTFDTTTVHSAGGAAAKIDSADGTTNRVVYIARPDGTTLNVATIFATFWVYYVTSPSSATIRFAQALDTTGANMLARLILKSDDTLAIYNAANTLVATSTATLPKNQWVKVELRLTRSTTGQYDVLLDGVNILTGTANFGSSGNIGYLILGTVGEAAITTFKWLIDDVFVDDAAFTTAEKVGLLLPDGAGVYTGWTNTYTNVDEAPPYSNADYIETTTSQPESVTLAALSTVSFYASGTPIKGVVGNYAASKVSGAGAATLAAFIVSNSSTSQSANTTLSSIEVIRGVFSATDPSGGGAWTEARVNALEVGAYLASSNTHTVRCYWLAAQVAFEATVAASASRPGIIQSKGLGWF